MTGREPAPGETARDHIANALQILAGHPDGYDLGADALAGIRRRLKNALADLDARPSLQPLDAPAPVPAPVPDADERERAAALMLRVEGVGIDPHKLAAYGYARCAGARCLGGIVPLGERCNWCGSLALDVRDGDASRVLGAR